MFLSQNKSVAGVLAVVLLAMSLPLVQCCSGGAQICSAAASPEPDGLPPYVTDKVECVWNQAYGAFPSIIKYRSHYYISFREAEQHIFDKDGEARGAVRILRSRSGRSWETVALLTKPGYDLRDPKLSVSPDGSLVVIMGCSLYKKGKLLSQHSHVSISSDGLHFPDPQPMDYPDGGEMFWIWRLAWQGDTGYAVSYSRDNLESVNLVKTTDGVRYETVSTITTGGFPNEATVRFLPDGRMGLFLRRDRDDCKAYWGTSSAPFTEWKLTKLQHRVGGPEFCVLPDGSILLGGRLTSLTGNRTCLWRGNAEGEFEPIGLLPSAGDNSYPGFLRVGNKLWVVYYSSHEDLSWPDGRHRAAVYLAKIPLNKLK